VEYYIAYVKWIQKNVSPLVFGLVKLVNIFSFLACYVISIEVLKIEIVKTKDP